MSQTPALRLGTRGSPLALKQAEETAARLRTAHPELAEDGAVEIVVIKTTGDRIQDRRLAEIGGKGLFTKEIEEALSEGAIDVAVHSMKDVPTWLPEGFALSAMLPREDPRDGLFSRDGLSLAELPAGAVIGSSSLRRQAQLKHRRPDLEVVSIRGNVDTRLAKMRAGQVDATLLAVAGLKRLDRAGEIDHCLTPDEMLPAVGQGAIGLEVRADDARTATYLAALDDRETALCVNAERACLEVLDGSCRTPIAAFAELQDGGQALRLRALVALPDGEDLWQDEAQGPADAPVELGRAVGTALRAAAGPEFFRRLAES